MSFMGVRSNVPVPEDAPAGMVRTKVLTGVNPTVSGLFGPEGVTIMVCSSPKTVPCGVAVTVTVVVAALSEMVVGLTLSLTDDGGSSSSVT